MRDFLLEIGTEEIPARFLPGALVELADKAEALLAGERLGYSAVRTYGTPRRLVLFVTGIPEKQEALVQEVKGPPRQAAFDAAGQPTAAAVGFARSQGVDVGSLIFRGAGKTEYVFALKEEPGRPSPAVLAELCPRLITGLYFPRPMRWGDKELRFIRPIRWLTALYGDKVIDFNIDGLKSGRDSQGHRFLAAGAVPVKDPADYFKRLAAGFVIVDPAERRRIIWEQVERLAAAEKGLVRRDEELLDEVVNMVEYPTAFRGSFPEQYLDLPAAVLVTAMREYQRYFPVYGKNGRLLPRFIAVHNSTPEQTAAISAGNEQVLRARLADASFFYREDCSVPLASRVEGLKKVVFQEELGTMYDKTGRLGNLVKYLGSLLKVGPQDQKTLSRAAFLAKADLLTNMVYEFPELQGVMGREYALKDGESKAVAEALYEQYLPRFAGDVLPQTLPGRLLSIADKVDNLVGCFGMGLVPTGSQDPYALRRQALGICHIILDGGLPVSIADLIARAYREYGDRLKHGDHVVRDELLEFLHQRLRAVFGEQGIRPDVTEAVLAAGADDIHAARLRAEALQDFASKPSFEDVHTAYTRAANLSRGAPDTGPDPAYFTDPAEQKLYEIVTALRKETAPDLNKGDYRRVLQKLSGLRGPVDAFFDAVLVMDEDRTLRENRLALLRAAAELVRLVADLGKVTVHLQSRDEGK
ncbi:MAG: glycine--tRNA ligase subunit beta [Ammonifex sp.]|nr:MAG: glycine--tRNA ligase subunit beta [Ammonifex sp.]